MPPELSSQPLISPSKLAVIQRFAHWSKQKPSIFKAPARINLIGEHTDYNLGYVLPAAIDRHIYFAIAPNESTEFLIDSVDLKDTVRFHPLSERPEPLWAQYFYSMVHVLQERGYTIPPVNCVFGGDIPIGSGLSSSAALTCGFIFGLNELYSWNLSLVDIVKMAQASEHQVGIRCGIMDQYAVLHGRENHVLQLDCLNISHQYFPLNLGAYALVLFNSMVSHSLADTAYNDRRQSCERVLQTIQQSYPAVQSLRDVNLDLLESMRSQLQPIDHQRVSFVLQENQRVIQTTEALTQGQLQKVGVYLYASHEGLSKVYEVSCEELDFLVDNIKGKTGVLGSRMMGGGFGGCTINLIRKDRIEEVANDLTTAYQKTFGKTPAMHIVQTGNGVRQDNA